MKVTVEAHPIQGLIKYHGLVDQVRRIPYHDSISLCVEAMKTTTTVESRADLAEDEVVINGVQCSGSEKSRILIVLDELRRLANRKERFRVASENSVKAGKGLGFSASGFAALGTAASKALGLSLSHVTLSEIVRLGAGSATRSLAGGYALWYADRGGRSYAEQIAPPDALELAMVIVPIPSEAKTDEAHQEVLGSPLFEARLKRIGEMVETMKRAIYLRDVGSVARLAEEDTLNLHATTMTGKYHMILWEPDTIRIIKEVVAMRSEQIPAWYSIDTGPSVFVNTYTRNLDEVASRIRSAGFENAVVSGVGGKPRTVDKHLF
ncbi:diphosphomevalonate decarboxylase [Candidatus Bathyarchaeota archaeon]|nr:diphosphomevalonate decarboxylase [Candidatus Bathyarchaeota archaeon]